MVRASGWLLFVVSALFFIFASLRIGDIIGLLGGIFYSPVWFFWPVI